MPRDRDSLIPEPDLIRIARLEAELARRVTKDRRVILDRQRQRLRLDKLAAAVDRDKPSDAATVAGLTARVAELEDDLGILALMTRAMLLYLKRDPAFDHAAFAALVKQVDASDGVIDGRVTRRRGPAR